MKNRRYLVAFASVLASAVAAPATACMADGPEGYVSGLIWERRHANVPDDSLVLRVEVVRAHDELPMGLVVRVVEGPDDLIGSTTNIVPANWTSCVGLGRSTGYVVVRRKTVQFGQVPGVQFFEAVDYLPDPADRSKGFKTENNWFVPGKPAPELWKPSTE